MKNTRNLSSKVREMETEIESVKRRYENFDKISNVSIGLFFTVFVDQLVDINRILFFIVSTVCIILIRAFIFSVRDEVIDCKRYQWRDEKDD